MPFRTICSPVGGSQAVCLAKSALQAFSCFLTVPPFHPVWIQKWKYSSMWKNISMQFRTSLWFHLTSWH